MPANPQPATTVNEKQALVCGLAAILLWSTVATGFKLGLSVLHVAQLLWLAVVTSWLVFFTHNLLWGTFRLQREDRWRVVLLGCLNPCAYYLILFAAFERLPAQIAQPLNYTWAITMAILAVPILKQPLGLRMLAGIVLSYLGVCVLLLTTGDNAGGWNVTGVCLALLSTVPWACYWLLNTRSTSPPGALMFWSFSSALPLIGCVCAMGPGWPPLNIQSLAYGAWIGCLEMGVTFLLWQHALRTTAHAGRMSQLIFISPFLSLMMIANVLGESIGPGVVVGLGVIVLGLIITRAG